MPQKLPVNGFKWVKKLSKFKEILIREITMKIAIRDIFSKSRFIIRKNYLIFIKICHFSLKKKVNKVEKFICNIEDK